MGDVFGKLGSATMNINSTFVSGDLTPLKWRCFGLAILPSPYIINNWFAGLIVDDILAKKLEMGVRYDHHYRPSILDTCSSKSLLVSKKSS